MACVVLDIETFTSMNNGYTLKEIYFETLVHGKFDPKTFGPETFNPRTFGPKTFDLRTYDPKTFAPKTFDPMTF